MTNSKKLGELIERLHDANRAISEAARPLDRVDQLDSERRKRLAEQMRAVLEPWELVTKEISQALTQRQDRHSAGSNLE